VKPGTKSDQLICLTDLFATVSNLLGKKMPENGAEDSVSFLPALYGKTIMSSRKGVIHHSISGHFSYRQGPWKLLLAKASGGWTSPNERQAPDGSSPGQLYNMSTDLGKKRICIRKNLKWLFRYSPCLKKISSGEEAPKDLNQKMISTI
jgi:hypothetical protein